MNKEDKLAAKLARKAEKEQRKLEKKALKAQAKAERASSRSHSLPGAPSVASHTSRRSGSSIDQESPRGREGRDGSVGSVTERSSSQSPGRAGSGSGLQRPHSLTLAGPIDTISGESGMSARPASLSLPAGSVKIPGEKRKGLKLGAVPGIIPKFGLKKKKKKDADGMSVISNESRMSMSMASVMLGEEHVGAGGLDAFTSPDRSSSFAGGGLLTMQSFGSRGINNLDSSASEEEEYEPEEGGRDSSPGSRGRRSRSPSPSKTRRSASREGSPARKQSPVRRTTSADTDAARPSSVSTSAGVSERTSKSPSIGGAPSRARDSSPEVRLRTQSPGRSVPTAVRQDSTTRSRDKSPVSASSRASLPPRGAGGQERMPSVGSASPGQSREASPASLRPSALGAASAAREKSPLRSAVPPTAEDAISSPPRNLSKSLSLPGQDEAKEEPHQRARPASMTLSSPAGKSGLESMNRSVSPGSGGSRPVSMSLSTGIHHAEKEKKKGLKLVPTIPKFGLGRKKKKKEADTMSVASNESMEAPLGFNLPEGTEAAVEHERRSVTASPTPADVEIHAAPREMDVSKSFESVGLDDDDDRHSVLSVENEGSVAGDRGRVKKKKGIGSITRRASSLLKPPGQVKKLLHLPGQKARAPSVDAALALPDAKSQSPVRHDDVNDMELPSAARKVSLSAPSSPQGKRKIISHSPRWGSLDEKVISHALSKDTSPSRFGSASPPGLPAGPPRERSQTTVVTSGSSLMDPETRSERSASLSPKSNRNMSLSGSMGESNPSVIVRENPEIVAQQAQDLRDQIEERKAQLAKMKTSLIGGGKKKKLKKELKKKELPELLERLQALENLKAQYTSGAAPGDNPAGMEESDGMTNVVLTPTEDSNVHLGPAGDGVSPDSVKAPMDENSPTDEKALVDPESMDVVKRKKSGIMGLGKGLMVSPRRASKALLRNAVLNPKQAINPKAFIKGATDQMEVEKERQHERAQSVDRTRSATMGEVPQRRATSVQPGTRLSKAEKKEMKREKKEEKKQLKRERKESRALELQMKRSSSKDPVKNKEALLPPSSIPSDTPAPKEASSEGSDEDSDAHRAVSPRNRDTRATTMAAVAQPAKREAEIRGRSRSMKRTGSIGSPDVQSPKFHSEPPRQRSVTRLDRDVDPSLEVPLLVRFPTSIQAQVFDENSTRAAEWTFEDGTKYQGDWAHGAPNGEGQLVEVDGSRYQGELKDGMKEGKGDYVSTVGQQYVGEWVGGKRHGYGVQTESEVSSRTVAEYRGEWENDVPHGQGEEYHKNGDLFRGTWVNGRKNAEGTFTYASGACFTGVWEDGRLVSAGAFTCPSGPFVSSPGPKDRPADAGAGSPGSPISVR